MTMRGLLTVRRMLVVGLLAAAASCATGNGTEPDPEYPEDAGETADAPIVEDSGKKDSGVGEDVGGPEDAGMSADAGFDGGARDVPTATDVGFDVGFDSGPRDTGPVDTGPRDTGPADTGPIDTGPVDSGPRDTGPVDTGPRDTGAPDVPTCTPVAETFNSRDDDCDGLVDEGFTSNGVSLACMGNGLVLLLGDRDIDDGGSTRNGDGLEFYCFNGTFRFCLTNEACPWRAGPPAVDNGQSCSSAGLASPSYFMAYYTTGYFVVGGVRYDEWYCPTNGRLRLALR
jgi:hypothetical protein